VPKRAPALLAKAAVVGAWCALVGLVIGFASWAIAVAMKPDADLALNSAADWRAVAGQALVYLMTAAAGVGLGLLLRSTAFALGVALVWTQLLEGLVVLIPGLGDDIYQWMPFFAVDQFIGSEFARSALGLGDMPMSPLAYGGYFTAICLALLGLGILGATKKDA
jgi:ABC-2 type transport system permease protein